MQCDFSILTLFGLFGLRVGGSRVPEVIRNRLCHCAAGTSCWPQKTQVFTCAVCPGQRLVCQGLSPKLKTVFRFPFRAVFGKPSFLPEEHFCSLQGTLAETYLRNIACCGALSSWRIWNPLLLCPGKRWHMSR